MSGHAICLRQAVVCIGERTILDAIDLQVADGERVAIVGPNGAGKSSLLKLMTGVVHSTHGQVRVLDHLVNPAMSSRQRRRMHADIGQVFQGLHLVQRLSTLENVLLGGLARNPSWLSWARLFPRAEVIRAEAALQAVGLIGKAQMRADRLSGGERQKAAIARMLMQAPRLILADEPTAALDPMASADIAHMLAALAQRHHMTLVTVVHDPGLLPLLAERVIGMRNGRIAFDLPVAEVDDDCLNRLYRDKSDSNTWMARLQRESQPLAAVKETE